MSPEFFREGILVVHPGPVPYDWDKQSPELWNKPRLQRWPENKDQTAP